MPELTHRPGLARYVPETICRLTGSKTAIISAARLGGTGLQLLTQVGLSQLGGPAAIAGFQIVMSWSMVLGEVIGRGTPTHAMRTIAPLWSRGDRLSIHSHLRVAGKRVVAGAIWLGAALIVLSALAPGLLAKTDLPPATAPYFIAIGALAFAAQRLCAESAKSMNSAVAVVITESLIPVTVLASAMIVVWLGALQELRHWPAIAAVATLVATSLCVFTVLRRRLLTNEVSLARPSSDASASGRETLAMWGVSLLGLLVLQLPFLVMPLFGGNDDIGVYIIAAKLMGIATTALVALAALFGPDFARVASQSSQRRARQLLMRSQLVCCAVFFPVAITVLLATPLLAIGFNTSAAMLKSYLLVIAIGQVVNAATGLPGLFLNMAGKATSELAVTAICLGITLVGIPLVGSRYGVAGLAWLFTVTTCLKNLGSLLLAHHTIRSWKQ